MARDRLDIGGAGAVTNPLKAALMIGITAMFSVGILFYALRWLWIAMIAVALMLQAYSAVLR